MSVETRLAVYRSIVRTAMLLDRLETLAFHPPARRATPSVVAATAALSGWIFPSTAELGAFVHRGVSFARYLDHVFGNADDATRGHSMPGYFTAIEQRIASVPAPTQGHLTHAVGYAWAARESDRAPVAAFADEAAIDSAEFHNAANFAGVMKAPVLFIVRSTGERSIDVADHAIAYGIESQQTDGRDLVGVYETVRTASEARRPAILEIVLADGGTEQLATLLGRAWDAAKESELRAATARELDEAVNAARGKNAPPVSSIGERLFR